MKYIRNDKKEKKKRKEETDERSALCSMQLTGQNNTVTSSGTSTCSRERRAL